LFDSIKTREIPILVRRCGNNKFLIIDGGQRFLIYKRLMKKEIECSVFKTTYQADCTTCKCIITIDTKDKMPQSVACPMCQSKIRLKLC